MGMSTKENESKEDVAALCMAAVRKDGMALFMVPKRLGTA